MLSPLSMDVDHKDLKVIPEWDEKSYYEPITFPQANTLLPGLISRAESLGLKPAVLPGRVYPISDLPKYNPKWAAAIENYVGGLSNDNGFLGITLNGGLLSKGEPGNIYLWPKGQRISTLLHEAAHLFNSGHGPGWERSYRILYDTYLELRGEKSLDFSLHP